MDFLDVSVIWPIWGTGASGTASQGEMRCGGAIIRGIGFFKKRKALPQG
jgi:hypothetical protein